MIYRVHLTDDFDGSRGYSYHGSFKAADQALRDHHARLTARGVVDTSPDPITCAPMPTTKAGIIALLAQWASHADNG